MPVDSLEYVASEHAGRSERTLVNWAWESPGRPVKTESPLSHLPSLGRRRKPTTVPTESLQETIMPKKPANHGKPWTPPQVQQLRKLATDNTPTRVIAFKLERTPDAVESKASEEHISLKPTNQSPYGDHSR